MGGGPRTPDAEPSYRYQLLRVALQWFGQNPEFLSPHQRNRAQRAAAEHVRLQRKVLRTPLAAVAALPDPVLEDAVTTLAARYPDEPAFQADLARAGLTREGLREALREELRAESVLEQAARATPAVTREEVEAFYEENQPLFRRTGGRVARHILITVNPQYEENTRAAASERIGAIAARLVRHPERFPQEAERHSECPTALRGGLLGKVREGTLYDALDRSLFSLEAGEISPVLESPLGFHLLRCDAVEEGGVRNLREVEDRIRARLQEDRRRLTLRTWLARQPEEGPLA